MMTRNKGTRISKRKMVTVKQQKRERARENKKGRLLCDTVDVSDEIGVDRESREKNGS